MRLIISRNQEQVKGFFGGNKGAQFELKCRVELTPEEHELATMYKIKDMTLTAAKKKPDKDISAFDLISPKTLLDGVSYTCRDVNHLLETEENIKSACKNFKLYLTVLATFGGEEVIEFADPRIELQREREVTDVIGAAEQSTRDGNPASVAV